jgi:hypothetical protein
MKRSGLLSLLLLLALVAGCGVRYGFAGGGLPQHIRTMAIVPFDNETSSPELQREIGEHLQRELRSRLGVRDASESRADAVVRGTIRSYELDVPVGFSSDPNQSLSSRRKLQIILDVEIIDQTTGRTLWERRGIRAEGEYAERSEADGRRQAIGRIVTDIVEGAQSQW